MELNPQRVRNAEFKTTKRGLDPDEVREFLAGVAEELERAQNQSTAMEARARAAVARLQELSESAGEAQQAAADSEPREFAPSVDEAETISRTLLLAQRTADTTVAEAKAEADRILGEANDEAANTLDSTREMSARLLDEAREEARKVGESERVAIASEVNALMARRDFLESDVDQLEQFLADQRNRLRDAASALIELTERVPSGLGDVRRPLLSASDDDAATDDVSGDAAGDAIDDAAADDADTDDTETDDTETDDTGTDDAGDDASDDVGDDVADDGTEGVTDEDPDDGNEPASVFAGTSFSQAGGTGGAHDSAGADDAESGQDSGTAVWGGDEDDRSFGARRHTERDERDGQGFRLTFDDDA